MKAVKPTVPMHVNLQNDRPTRKHILSFEQAEIDVLTLTGELDGHHIRAKARRSEGAEFLLLNRGFHWNQRAAVQALKGKT